MRRFPSLSVQTPRLLVRPLAVDDAKLVTEMFDDKLVRRWIPVAEDDVVGFDGYDWCTELAIERRDSGSGDHYGIVRREDERLVGCLWTKNTDWLARSTEIAYAVAAGARGYGVAPEAVDVLALALLLEHRFQRVELRVVPGNLASRRVAEKAGFTYEGLLRNAGHVHSGRVDLEMWSLVAADLR
jgi:RimJ/RimL family protein N-acetyltransferase